MRNKQTSIQKTRGSRVLQIAEWRKYYNLPLTQKIQTLVKCNIYFVNQSKSKCKNLKCYALVDSLR